VAEITGAAVPGFHRVTWDMRKKAKDGEAKTEDEESDGFEDSKRELVPAGEYTVVLKAGDRPLTRRAVIREMPGSD